jgi:hypothetical protein
LMPRRPPIADGQKMGRRAPYALKRGLILDLGRPEYGRHAPHASVRGGGWCPWTTRRDASRRSCPWSAGKRQAAARRRKREGALGWAEVARRALHLHLRDHVHRGRPEGGPPRAPHELEWGEELSSAVGRHDGRRSTTTTADGPPLLNLTKALTKEKKANCSGG